MGLSLKPHHCDLLSGHPSSVNRRSSQLASAAPRACQLLSLQRSLHLLLVYSLAVRCLGVTRTFWTRHGNGVATARSLSPLQQIPAHSISTAQWTLPCLLPIVRPTSVQTRTLTQSAVMRGQARTQEGKEGGDSKGSSISNTAAPRYITV